MRKLQSFVGESGPLVLGYIKSIIKNTLMTRIDIKSIRAKANTLIGMRPREGFVRLCQLMLSLSIPWALGLI